MNISTDINCFYKVYTEKETVKLLADAGFDAIDYTFMNDKYYGGEISDNECREYYLDLKKYAEEHGVFFNQSHAPCPSGSFDNVESDRLFNNMENPPVTLTAELVEVEWDFNYGYCDRLPKSTKPLGIIQKIKLIPYGCTNLRMTEIPFISKEGV